MPLYEVEHVCPLTVSQQDDLAAAITRIHAEKFTTPKLFVNRNTNRIIASVRPGASRSQADYADLCRQIEEAWAEVVPLPQVKRSMPVPDTELRAVFVLGKDFFPIYCCCGLRSSSCDASPLVGRRDVQMS
ncbi:hypothetical protein LTR28_013811 [Elasticomyces elasticus]|nr:hypothetical protein LTR28_013811 [Elasticomyces elasticus]